MPARPVTPLDTTELGELLTYLTVNPSHPGIRLVCHGLALIAEDTTLTVNDTQVLLAELAGSPDGTDLLGALGHLVARLTNPDSNPALRTLPDDDNRKTAQLRGQRTAHTFTHYSLRNHPSTANAHLEQSERGCKAVTDDERKELSKKVADANKRSEDRPR